MSNIRFPSAEKKLEQSELRGDTLLPCRYKAGTSDDADKSITFSLMQSSPVASCTSSAESTTKVATIDNFPDFELVNGREVVVYFVNGNSAENPSMNINGTGAIAMDGAYWNAESFMKLKYVDITISGTRIQRWLVDMGAYNSDNKLNSAIADKVTNTQLNDTLANYVPKQDLYSIPLKYMEKRIF